MFPNPRGTFKIGKHYSWTFWRVVQESKCSFDVSVFWINKRSFLTFSCTCLYTKAMLKLTEVSFKAEINGKAFYLLSCKDSMKMLLSDSRWNEPRITELFMFPFKQNEGTHISFESATNRKSVLALLLK